VKETEANGTIVGLVCCLPLQLHQRPSINDPSVLLWHAIHTHCYGRTAHDG
jgi:hypothetical protein